MSLKQFAHFINTPEKRVLKPLNSLEKINYSFKRQQEIVSIYTEEFFYELLAHIRKLDEDEIFYKLIGLLKKDIVLDLKQVNEIVLLTEVYYKDIFSKTGFEFEDENSFKQRIQKFSSFLTKEFRSFYNEDNSYDYLKHPKLRNLYKEQLELESQIRKSLQVTLTENSNSIQYSNIDIINDRYVIPIKSDHYTKKHGHIISRSESGQTLFVEPINIKNSNYRRLEIVIELAQAIEKLQREYSKKIREYTHELNVLSHFVFFIDEYKTRADFCSHYKLSIPTLREDTSEFFFDNFFHPLIEKPVKNSLNLEGYNGLLISGPNAGGKTAILKTVALSAIFNHYALGTPARFAKMGFYKKIYYFGSDGQNLDEGLSSFAAEVTKYSNMVKNIEENSLVIIDEIFNTTSSEEASALAIAIFEQLLLKQNITILASTHHQMLKSFIHQKNNFLSAHVGFDNDRPTYILHTGTPGSSYAISTFERYTKDVPQVETITKRAKELMDKKHVHYEAILEKINKKEHELSIELKEQRMTTARLKNQESSMQGVLKLKMDNELKSYTQKLNSQIEKLYSLKKKIKNKEDISLKDIDHLKRESNTLIENKQTKEENSYKDLKKPKSIIIGSQYFSTFLKSSIHVLSIDERKKVVIGKKGAIQIKCPIDSLRITNNSSKNENQGYQVNFNSNTKLEYDCRGMRLEEFRDLVERTSSSIISGEVPFINYIHGHGTGVLKNWLRKFIKRTSDLKIQSNETGNDGQTTIELKS